MKTMRVLNRIVEWKEHSICYEADQRHAEIICQEMGIKTGSKEVVTPGVKGKYDAQEEEELDSEESSQYRALVARANYLAQDRPDIQYSVKELCREMSSPKVRSWNALKRLARYLLGHPRSILEYKKTRKAGPPGNMGRHGLCRLHSNKEVNEWRSDQIRKACSKILEFYTESNFSVIRRIRILWHGQRHGNGKRGASHIGRHGNEGEHKIHRAF